MGSLMPTASIVHDITAGLLSWVPLVFFGLIIWLVWRTVEKQAWGSMLCGMKT